MDATKGRAVGVFFGRRLTPARTALAAADGICVAVVLALSSVCHYSGSIPPQVWDSLQATAVLAAALLIVTNALFGLYNRVWKYATADTALAIAASVTLSQASAALLGKHFFGPLPVGVWATSWLGTMAVIGLVRFFWRAVRPRLAVSSNNGVSPKRVIVYGAGAHGEMLVRSLKTHLRSTYQVVGYVDDDPAKLGAIVGYAKVLGSGHHLPALVDQHEVEEVILAMPRATRAQIEAAYERCRAAGVRVRVMPHILEAMDRPGARRLRELDVADLLGRRVTNEDVRLVSNYLEGKTILVTGAGGSIGSELCRQICRYDPKCIVLLGRGENRIHWLYLELQSRFPGVQAIPIVANVGVRPTVERALGLLRPDVVIHAAAHKHVYLMEFTPAEAARNNVLATALLAEQAERYGVSRFIMISTDKAACPTNVMGATKRMAELVLTCRPYAGTTFTCVRFGNVLGSEGSVLEIFRRQWSQKEPLTITHPEATRYFMSIPEACFLVLQAGALNGHGNIFLLDMGEPVRIMDLARKFISLQGGDPDAPGAIEVTGLRPGERIHETLVCPDEEIVPTDVEWVGRVQPHGPPPSWRRVVEYLRRLEECCETEDDEGVCRVLEEATGATLCLDNCHSRRFGRLSEGQPSGKMTDE